MNEEKKFVRSRLGQGLDAFFGSDETQQSGESISQIQLDQIMPAKWQPRKNFDELNELAESIKIHGVLQPILLKKVENQYEIIAGERRYRASVIAKKETIPAIIVDFSNQQALEVSMIENLQRKDLNPIEKAEGFAFLIEKLNLSQDELAKRLGMNRTVVTNFLRINTLSEAIKQQIREGKISAGHAKVLVNKSDASDIAKEIVEKKLSVRQVEEKLRKPEVKKAKQPDEILRFQEMISQKLGVTTRIECEKNFGKVILEFNSLSELEDIISSICLE